MAVVLVEVRLANQELIPALNKMAAMLNEGYVLGLMMGAKDGVQLEAQRILQELAEKRYDASQA